VASGDRWLGVENKVQLPFCEFEPAYGRAAAPAERGMMEKYYVSGEIRDQIDRENKIDRARDRSN